MNPEQQIDLSKSSGLICQNCEGIFFKQSILLRRFSKFYTGTPEDPIVPVAVFRCEQCEEICKDYFPRGMNDIEELLGLSNPVSVPEPPKSKLIQM